MRIKLSATFEGKCDFCGKEKLVFSAGDEDTHKVITICQDCTNERAGKKTSEMIEEFGHKDDSVFDEGVRVEKKPTAG